MERVTMCEPDQMAPPDAEGEVVEAAFLQANPCMNRRTLLGAAAVLGGLCLADAAAGQPVPMAYASSGSKSAAETAIDAEVLTEAEFEAGVLSSMEAAAENYVFDPEKLSEAALVASLQGAEACYEADGKPYQGEGHKLGSDFRKYPVFYGETDEFGFHILTEKARGCRLAHGYSYRVRKNLILEPAPGSLMAALAADNNLIYVDANCTLAVRGSNGKLGRLEHGGLPGIALYGEDAKGYAYSHIIGSLMLCGEGTVCAYGGKAADGMDGQAAQEAWHTNDDVFSGCGGDGGRGGGGGGAGIGTAGGGGGVGSMGGRYVVSKFVRHSTDKNGNNGNFKADWGDPSGIWNPGELCIAGNIRVQAYGGQMSTHQARGGKASSWKKYKSESITKHLTGGSGGGAGNGYGKGGIGGTGGGGGGSAGAMWRTVGTSDDPPTASGGRGGENLEQKKIKAGDGEGSVRYISRTKCHGGTGGRAGRFLKGLSYSPDSTRFPVYAYGKASANAYMPKNPFRYESAPCKIKGATISPRFATMVKLNDYTEFANIRENGGWYIKNPLFNVDETGTQSRELITIAGVTVEKDLLKALAINSPARTGYHFLGWALANDTSKLVYDAESKKIDANLLVEKKKAINRSSGGILWMCPNRTEFTAVWKQLVDDTYSVVYHTNGGSFTDLAGKAVAGESYAETGHKKNDAVTLWNNSATGTIGIYLLKPPADVPAGTKQLGWALKVDKQGYPAGTVYGMGATVANLNPKGLKEVHLYAVWKEENVK